MFKIIFLCIIILISCTAMAQQQVFSGRITDSTGAAVVHASILLKYTLNDESKILYTLSDSSGRFHFRYTSSFKQTILDISVLGFEKYTSPVDLDHDSLVIRLASKTNLLPSVIVTNNYGVKVNGDTTTFSLGRFSNKNEQSVEELLKKIPGFDVDNEGNIKFNGRQIERVLIEGDDLYGGDFKMLTKNLSADLVDQVQAIDNYNDNPLLRGLTKSNKQVLNLKLKKKVLLGGSIDLGGGVPGGKYDNRLNVLSVTPKAKVTVLGNMNNIGVSPFSFTNVDKPENQRRVSQDYEIAVDKNNPVVSSKELNYQGIDAKRSNINNSKIINSGFLSKPAKNFTIKGGIYFIDDKSSQQQRTGILFLTTTPAVTIKESNYLSKRQSFKSFKLGLDYTVKEKQLFKYDFTYERGSIDHLADMNLLSGKMITSLSTESSHMENRFHYTNRLSANAAFEIEALYNYGKNPQDLVIRPVPYAAVPGFNPDSIALLRQTSNNPVKQLSVMSRLVGVQGQLNYSVNCGFNDFDRQFTAGMYGIDSSGDAMPANKQYMPGFSFQNRSFVTDLSASYKKGDWQFDGTTNFTLGKTQLTGILPDHYHYFQHRLTTTYKIKKGGNINAQYSYKKDLPETTDLIPAWWLSNYRTFRKGVAQFEIAPQHNVSINYSLADFFRRQLLAYCGLVYLINGVRYIDDVDFNVLYQTDEKLPYAVTNHNYIAYARLEKYVRPFSGNITLDINTTWGNYLNKSSGAANYIRFNSTDIKLGFKSAWQTVNVLLQSTVKLRSQQINGGTAKKSNDNVYHESRASIYYLPTEKLNFELKTEYYLMPDGSRHKSYVFFDFTTQYTLLKDKLVLNFTGNNLSNVRELAFNTISPTQFSTQSFNLLQRYFLLKLHYIF